MDLGLRDKVAIVTGASACIGRGVAKVLAAEEATTVIVWRRKGLRDTLGKEIEAAGGAVAPHRVRRSPRAR